MIDDLLTDLTVGALERNLASDVARDEADFELARLAQRLAERKEPASFAGESAEPAEARLFAEYLSLSDHDLEDIPPRVHAWLIQRLSAGSVAIDPDVVEKLALIYLLFPRTAVQSAVVGLLLKERETGSLSERLKESPLERLLAPLFEDVGLLRAERDLQVDTLLDYVVDDFDAFPKASQEALAAIVRRDRSDRVIRLLQGYAAQLGEERAARIDHLLDRGPFER